LMRSPRREGTDHLLCMYEWRADSLDIAPRYRDSECE